MGKKCKQSSLSDSNTYITLYLNNYKNRRKQNFTKKEKANKMVNLRVHPFR